MPAKGKATHGSLGGNAKQFGNSTGGGRTNHKPGAPSQQGNFDASNKERRKGSSRVGTERQSGTVPKSY